MNFEYKTISKVGYIRSGNEDAFGVFNAEGGLLAIVCDGLGGSNAGEVASKFAVDMIHQNFIESSDENYIERIRLGILNTNRLLYEKASSDFKLNGMSTTAEVLFIKDNQAYFGHIGDSRIYIFADDILHQLTKDHSFVQKLVDEGLISEKEAEVHPNKNIITKALGDSNSVDADVEIINIKPGVFFLLCTDGVYGVIDNNELREILRLDDMENISDTICNLVEDRGAPDNFSFVLINVK